MPTASESLFRSVCGRASCHNSSDGGKNLLDLDADIIPGVGAAGITIGQSVLAVLALGMKDDMTYGPVTAQADQYGMGTIDSIWVKQGYRGKLAGKIGIGSRIAEVVAAFGPVQYIAFGEYQLDVGTPWLDNNWSFSVERGSPVNGEQGWENVSISCISMRD